MAYPTDDMGISAKFLEEYPARPRITSPAEHLARANVVGIGEPLDWGGAELIQEQIESADEPTLLIDDGAASAEAELLTAIAAETADLSRAVPELHQLMDVPEGWPEWSLARRALKRGFDVTLSALALLVLLPLFIVIAVAIRVESSGPALYRQRRCGRDDRCFEMLKFRSMVRDADQLVVDMRDLNESDGLLFKVKDDPRVTRVGKLIRKYSIDELPQLINVLIGDMSLVGPRPLPVDPDDFGPIDGKRHAVRPGLTCRWQVSGRSDLTYGQMVEMDLDYIRNSSLWTDICLIALTVPVVFGGDGAY